MASPPTLRKLDLGRLLSSSLAPVQAQILAYLGPKEFLALSKVSKPVYVGLKKGLRATIYNIDIKLKKFFSDPKAFRKVQAECNALIGDADGNFVDGNFVHRFLSNEQIPNELHLYVPYKEHATLERYLEAIGYTLHDLARFQEKLHEVGLYKSAEANAKPRYVALHQMEHPILYYFLHMPPSTFLTSFITWNKAYCLYPRSGLLMREGYLLKNLECSYPAIQWRDRLHALSKENVKTKCSHWDVGDEESRV